MANRQEELMEKLETVIREKWKEEGAKIYVEERNRQFWSKLSSDEREMFYDIARNKYLKVKRKQNSISIEVDCMLYKFRKTIVNAKKSGNDLLVFSEGFHVLLLPKIVLFMMWFGIGLVLIFPIIAWLKAPSPPTELVGIIGVIRLILLLYGILLSYVFWRGRKGLSVLTGKAGIWSKETQEVLDIFLKGSIEKTINLFK